MGWFRRLFAAPTCPGCGLELVRWTTLDKRAGFEEERKWVGCPRLRDSGPGDYAIYNLHAGHWTRGRRTPLVMKGDQHG